MAHIALGFFARQGLQVVSAGDPLGQLAQLGPVQQLPKFRLTDQYDLQQLLGGRLQIGQEADLLQYIDGEILCLIDQHDDAPTLRVGAEQASIQCIDHLLDAVAIGLGDFQSQLFAYREKKLHGRDAGIQNHGDIGMMRYARQQRAHHRGFTRSDLSG